MGQHYMVNSSSDWQISPKFLTVKYIRALLLAHAGLARILHY